MTSHDHHDHEPWGDLPEGFADHLELEALLSEPVRAAALDRAALAFDAAPSQIVDLGSGTGADAIALAQRFPAAAVHALDVSPELLERVRTATVAAGVADRVERHRADLDGDWTANVPSGVDLVWSALALHHVGDPEAVLQKVYAALRPGGVFVLTELAGDARFEPADLGTGSASLRDRVTQALAHAQHASPDWSALLDEAGFTVVECYEHEMIARASTTGGARYLATTLRAQRDRFVHDMTSGDVAELDAAIDAVDAGASAISSHSPRTVWIATRPLTDGPINRPETIEADVAVLGGGSAGLAAAIALGRSRRKVVVIDAGHPRNAPAEGAHNVLGNEGISPHELLARGRAEAESYAVRIVQGQATAISGTIDDFTIDVADGSRRVHARRVILATGLVDDLPDVPGVQAGWGHSVLHCAFCHGWEIRDQRIAILTREEVAVHQAMMFSQLSDQVTVFLHDAPDPTEEQWEQLRALNVSVVRPRVQRLILDGPQVRGLEIDGGQTFDADAVVIVPRYNARTELYESLGGTAETTPFGRQIPADPRGLTAVPGVFATGNASQPMAMVVASAAAGVTTGTAVHGDLAFSDLKRAVEHVGRAGHGGHA